MSRHTLNDAEQGFFGALLNDDGQTKVAVDLEPETVDALGIPAVSPSFLSHIEEQASAGGQAEAKPDPPVADKQQAGEGAQQEPPAEQVEQFDRSDQEPKQDPVPEPELPTRATYGKLFTDKRAHPLQLLEVLTMRYKTAWAGWESDTLWWALRRSFGPVGEVVRNKIMALRLAATTDTPWLDWDVFEDSGLAWNDIVPTIGTFQPMTPMQAAFSVQILKGIRPDDQLSHEVKAYIAAILDDHGWVWAPDEWFGGAQEILEKGLEHLVGLKNEVQAAWEQTQDADPTEIQWNEEDPRDIHVLKLFVVKRYLEQREAERQEVPGMAHSSTTASPAVP